MQNQYDIVIIGAGLVGLSFAAAMAETELKIAVLDGRSKHTKQIGQRYDMRVFAINRASEKFLQELQVWDAITESRISPYENMRVWDSTGDGEINFSCVEIGENRLGHIIENQVIENALLVKLTTFDNVTLISPVSLTEFKREDNAIILTTEDGETYSTQLLIGADGANSWVRQQAGIECEQQDYGHHALVATIKTEKSHAKTAWQRFMPSGPLAFLPLQDEHLASIVWSNSPKEIARLKLLNDEKFNQELESAFDSRLGKVSVASQRVAFPLKRSHVKHYTQDRIALIGDAAHTIHPLAGQGVNLGLNDAKTLARHLKAALKDNRDYHAHYILRKYERSCKSHNTIVQHSMSGFKDLFGNTNPLLTWVRNTGLNLSNRVTPLKRLFIDSAA